MTRAMKDSGIEWIGEIPEDWQVAKLGYFFDIQLGKMLQPTQVHSEDTFEKYICAANLGGNKLKTASLKEMWFSSDEKNSLTIQKGDLLVVEGGDVASCDIVDEDFENVYFQNSIHRARARCAKDDIRMLKYWLWVSKSIGYIDLICNKATIAHFSKDKFLSMPFLKISSFEQQQIADFLDDKVSQIDSTISKTRESIEEYKKLKQSIITEAVSGKVKIENGKLKGKYDTYKDSGIEWIGEIPEDWELRKLFRAIDKIGDIDHYMPDSVDSGIPYLMTGDLKEKLSQIDFDACKQVSFEDYEILSSKIKATHGDVIFARYATIGTVCIVDIDKEFLLSYSCLTIKPTQSLLIGIFLFYYLKSTAFFEDVKQYINSNTQANVGLDSMTKAKIVIPSLHEQQQIADYLDKKCSEIDSLITKKEQLVVELEAYKKSLIYEVVTGKRCV